MEGIERRDNRETFNRSRRKKRENVEETRQTVRGRDKREIIRGDVYQERGVGRKVETV